MGKLGFGSNLDLLSGDSSDLLRPINQKSKSPDYEKLVGAVQLQRHDVGARAIESGLIV